MSKPAIPPSVGQSAPDLTLPREDGTSFGLKEVAGRPALISFLSHAA